MGGLPRSDTWEAVMAHIDFEISGGGTVYFFRLLTHEARRP
jgi:hypothetical protein